MATNTTTGTTEIARISKIEDLKKDICRLEKALEWINYKLLELDKDPKADQSQVPKLIKEKNDTEELLEGKRVKLQNEEFKEKTKPSDEEQKKRQKIFDDKNNSYSITRSSYIRVIE